MHAVLCGLFGRIPANDRDHILVHLPQDVRDLVGPSARASPDVMRVRRLSDFVALIVADGEMPAAAAETITTAVVTTLRHLVPEESSDVAAVLPSELRQMWQHDMPELRSAP